MVTLDEYKEAASACTRLAWYFVIALPINFLTVIIAIFVCWRALVQPHVNAALEPCAHWFVHHQMGPRLITLICLLVIVPIALPLCVLLSLPFIVVYRLVDRRNRRDRRLFCPHCGAVLKSLVTATGNCQRCGRTALDLPEGHFAVADSEEHDHQLLPLDEFKAAIRNRRLLRDPKQSDPRLKCPGCQADLYSRAPFYIVSTRKCPRCEIPVLEDPEATAANREEHPEHRGMPLTTFAKSHWTYGRWCLSGGMAVIGLVYVLIYQVGFWITTLERSLGLPLCVVLVLVLFIMSVALGITAASLAAPILRRIFHMSCPHCGRSLFHERGIVIATHRCYHCGRRAVAENSATEPVA